MAIIEGDPFGPIKDEQKPAGPEPRDVNLFHSRSDVDSSQMAQHHTLGVKHDQASAGDHNHDGSNSRLIGTGMGLSVDLTSGSADDKINRLATMLQRVMDFTTT